ncbi:glutathione S-transferase [Xylariales sp. PMI_506]|nr:glutathione S-transferase [Xylariales sp. PMI_506]
MSPSPTPALKLWYSPGACSFVPHVALIEAGLDFEVILAQVRNMTKEFEAINPQLKVPVLALGDEIITEMSAVLTAIASLVPEKKFLGRTTIETIRVYEWLNYLSSTAHGQAYAGLWQTYRFVKDPELYPAVREKSLEAVKDCYSLIDTKLKASGSMYAVGDAFTVVDPFLVVLYCWASRLGLEMEAAYPSYARYAKELLKSESVIEARKVHVNV